MIVNCDTWRGGRVVEGAALEMLFGGNFNEGSNPSLSVPYRVRNGKIEVLLITSHRRQDWGIPKGGISKAMSPPDSAAKEAWEEAGLVGQVDDNQLSQRQRQWLELTKAVKRVKKASLKRMLKTAIATKLNI